MTLVQRLVILVVAALAPVLAGVAYSLGNLRETREQEIRADAARVVALVGAQHQSLMTAVSEILLAVSLEAPRAVERPASCAAIVARLAGPAHRWLDVLVLDARGIVRCSTVPGTLGADRSGLPEIIAAAAQEGLVLGALGAHAFQDEPTLPAALRWRGANGDRGSGVNGGQGGDRGRGVNGGQGGNQGGNQGGSQGGSQGDEQGVVLAIVRPRMFVAPIIPAVLPAHAAVLVADRAGRVLYVVPDAPLGGAVTLPPSLAASLRRAQPGTARAAWFDGSDRVVAQAPLNLSASSGAVIIAGIEHDAAMADIDRVASRITWVLAITLLAATLLAYWGGVRFIRRPLGVLTAAALRWRDGDHAARVRLPGRTEIAALGRVFDEMAEATEHSERQTRESAELLNALIESSADGIFVSDREGCFVLVNSTFARLLGRDRAALAGVRDEDAVGPQMRAAHAAVLSTRQSRIHDLLLPVPGIPAGEPAGKTESQRVLHTIYAPILSPAGDVIAIAGIARDVTDERHAAAELRAAKERAELADESKTRFLAAASHDLRQPVQAAILFANVIAGHATDVIAKPVEQLRLVLDDLRVMLDSLFDVSRYDTHAVQPDIVAFPLQPLIDQITASAGVPARAKGLRLIAEPTTAWVRSDRALLGRMVGNIVQNAVRYTEQGSVTIGCTVSAGILRLDVRDTGPGIAPEDIARIWQEFEQLHNPERDRRQGLGLGLAIVRRLSRMLVHPVHVTSAQGQGSCFSIEIPTAEPVAAAALPTPSLAPGAERIAIVVEDDVPLLSVLGMILEDHGWQAVGVADEHEALERLAPGAAMPDVILTDYRLRGGKLGSDAIAVIREKIGRAIPAIILTGEIAGDTLAADGPQRDAERLGGTSVLRKPVTAAVLIAALTSAVAGHG